MLPSIFVSHGAPSLGLTDAPAKHFLKALPGRLPTRPRAVVVVSAHWETNIPIVTTAERHGTIHDFYGFPQALYDVRYDAPGAPDVAARILELLAADGLPAAADSQRGLDHGAWVPLMLMYPQADVPVVQLSIQPRFGPEYHLAIGRLLAPLATEDVLVLASGSFTHDLSSFRTSGGRIDAPEPEWVADFADWFGTALDEGRVDDLLNYRRLAPHARRNHPTEEHLLPLYVALGAAGDAPQVTPLHRSTNYGILRMDAFAFMPSA